MARILIVEDEPDLRSAVETIFRNDGFEVFSASTIRAAKARMESEPADVVVLDLGLPDGNGLDLVRNLRTRKPRCGLIIVTGKGDPIDRILGLELGADDYVTKPFIARELIARVRSVLRRMSNDDSSAPTSAKPDNRTISVRTASVNVPGRIVSLADGTVTVLSAVEMGILLCLHGRIGQAVTRDDLSLAVLGRPWDPEDRTVDQNVSSLRRKLGLPAGDQDTILTVRGVGYMLCGELG